MKIKKEWKDKIKLSYLIKILIIICILYNIIFLINTTMFKKQYLRLFGITILYMENDLMQDDINKNDLVIIKKENHNKFQVDDIIAYEVNGQTRINKIIYIEQDEYITKSNKNYYPDIERVKNNQIIGKKIINIRFLGILLKILQSKITNIIIIVLLFLKLLYNKDIYIKKKKRAIKKAESRKITVIDRQ